MATTEDFKLNRMVNQTQIRVGKRGSDVAIIWDWGTLASYSKNPRWSVVLTPAEVDDLITALEFYKTQPNGYSEND